jgi:hypothetical protein
MHETNKIVVFSPLISDQIPKSYAAHAFNLFRDNLYEQELIRICAIWDSADHEKESIPSVVQLINSPSIINLLAVKLEASWNAVPSKNISRKTGDAERDQIITEIIKRKKAENDKKRAENTIAKLKDAINKAAEIEKSDELTALRNYRDKYLAHSLSKTRREKAGPVPEIKYGYERKILDETIPIFDGLLLGISNSSYSWEQYKENAVMCAEALWGACKFEVKN